TSAWSCFTVTAALQLRPRWKRAQIAKRTPAAVSAIASASSAVECGRRRRRSSGGSARLAPSRAKVAKSGRRWVRPERMVSRQSVRFAAEAATSQARAKRVQRAAIARPARGDMGGSVARGARGRQGGRGGGECLLAPGGLSRLLPQPLSPARDDAARRAGTTRGRGGTGADAPVKHFPDVSRTPRGRRGGGGERLPAPGGSRDCCANEPPFAT